MILLILAALRSTKEKLPESKRSPVSHYRSNVVTAQARNDKKHRAVRITTLDERIVTVRIKDHSSGSNLNSYRKWLFLDC